ncbi:ATP-binding protein [Meridianimarinicoccus aquatilis]|uniref:histidine kinase n=1 Tax=Meridianimarinicoccus aquatilis TaxID=2552766 RepID=A0A4R6AMM0_9RHOB|nr:ATP-binding protein [Fluviibacterium aquatile]TDL84544.1 response regulator [Fluviibacterium aquatile]
MILANSKTTWRSFFYERWTRLTRLTGQGNDPLCTVLAFAVFSVLFILAGMTHQFEKSEPAFFAFISPHVASVAFVLALVVLPPRQLWYAIVVFVSLYGFSFVAPNMRDLPLDGTYAKLMVHFVVFQINFGLALIVGLLARNASTQLSRVFPAYDHNLLTVSVVGGFLFLLGPLTYITVWAIGSALNLQGWQDLDVGPDHIGCSVMMGIWASLAVSSFVLLSRFAFRRRDRVPSILGVLALSAVLVWIVLRRPELPELEVSVLLLMLAIILPCAASAVSIVFIAVTGPAVGLFAYTGEHRVAETASSDWVVLVILVLVFVVVIGKYEFRKSAHERRVTEERLERLYQFADVGRFSVDLRRGICWFDPAAERMTGMPPRHSIAAFMRCVHPEDVAELSRAFSDQSGVSRTVTAQFEMCNTTGQQQVLKFYFWYEVRSKVDKFAHGFIVNVTEEHTRGVELETALAKLSDKQQFQSEMFSMISHELRTPTSLMSMFIERMDEGEDWETIGPKMRNVSSELLQTLADIRQSVNPEQNLPVSPRPIVPIELLEEIKANYDFSAKNSNVSIEIALSDAAFDTTGGDLHRLRQAIANLVRNAILHADCRRIDLSYTCQFNELGRVGTWRVEDDGKGIDPNRIDSLYEPFQRGPASVDQADGSGLGLYIVKSSIELLGGTVTYTIARTGGACFELQVPEFGLDILEAQSEADVQHGRSDMGVKSEDSGVTGQNPDQQLWDAHVLLAEDHQMIRELMGGTLRKIVRRVSLAADGKEALEMFNADKPDIVFTDLFMPKMSGDELAAAIRLQDPVIPIIGVTAAIIGNDADRFRQSNASEVAAKPLNRQQLRDLIKKYVTLTPVAERDTI